MFMSFKQLALFSAVSLALSCGGDEAAAPTTAYDVQVGVDVFDAGPITLDIVMPDTSNTEEDTAEEQTKYKPCQENKDCDSELCVLTQNGKVCTEQCITNCPQGFSCSTVTPLGADPITVCVPKYLSLCFPCKEDIDCTTVSGALQSYEGTKCVMSASGASFCAGPCDADVDCPTDFKCNTVEIEGKSYNQCVPESGECKCSVLAESIGAISACSSKNEFGVCTGTVKCADGELTVCNAATPAAEVCDGKDNDCDNTTDEFDGDDNSCAKKNEWGECKGTRVCQQGE